MVDRWLAEAQAGSRSALGRALEASRKYLLLVANQSLDDALRAKGGASDLVQDTFVEAQRHFDRFTGKSEEELLAWLTAILINRLRNNVRHYHAEMRDVDNEIDQAQVEAALVQLRDYSATPGADAIARDEQRRVQLALVELTEPQREVLNWRAFQGLTFVEIGQRYSCSEEAARKRWVRAVRELEKVLERIR